MTATIKGKERFRQELIAFLQKMDRDGCYSDDDRQVEGGKPLATTEGVEHVAFMATEEIGGDINSGTVPATVTGFADLHDHVDANGYGGAFDWPTLVGDVDDDPEYVQAHCDFWNAVQDVCDLWIKAGRPDALPFIESLRGAQ